MVTPYKPLYTIKDVSELIGCNPGFVYQLVNTKELPCLLINGKKQVRGSDLERWIENHPVME
jgi:hypothetical protein